MNLGESCLFVLELAALYCQDRLPTGLSSDVKKEIAFIYFNNISTSCDYFSQFTNLMLLDLSKSPAMNCMLSDVEVLLSVNISSEQTVTQTSWPGHTLPVTVVPFLVDSNPVPLYLFATLCIALLSAILVTVFMYRKAHFYPAMAPSHTHVYQYSRSTPCETKV